MKINRRSVLLLLLIWCAVGIILINAGEKLTYLEYTYINENTEDTLTVDNTEVVIEQDFTSPYSILHGISLMPDTFERNNNANLVMELIETDSGKAVYRDSYRASWRSPDEFNLFKFDKNIAVRQGNTYTLRIRSTDASENTGIAFYIGPNEGMSPARVNGEAADGSLCLMAYGGMRDLFWYGLAILIGLVLSAAVLRGSLVLGRGLKLSDDRVFTGMLTGFTVFFLLGSFAAGTTFMDELDNLRGGMVIANGGVLYRDYVAQHTPVMYYLCGIFALFGAGSPEQFRLSYYLFEAVVWSLLYMRHSGLFGKKKMAVLAALECIITPVLFSTGEGRMILSDNMQGLCTVVLVLELLRYLKLKKIGWDNSIIISLAIWGNIGSAFVGAYAVSAVVMIVLVLEIRWTAAEKPAFPALVKRYAVLLICMLVPLAAGALYFLMNHALSDAFEQFYLFNRQVYADYATFGDNIAEPYITSVMNFPTALANRFMLMITAQASAEDVLQFAVLAAAAAALVTMCMKKRYAESLGLFLPMILSASRGYSFHGMGAFYTAVPIIAFGGEDLAKAFVRKFSVPAAVLAALMLLSPYVRTVGTNLLYEEQPVSELESRVVSMTEENEKILLDAYSCDTLYLLHKGHYPVNRAVYMLPWYMDWYEKDNIDDLNREKPRLVLYFQDEQLGNFKYYTNAFLTELRKNYTQLSEDPQTDWAYELWIRND